MTTPLTLPNSSDFQRAMQAAQQDSVRKSQELEALRQGVEQSKELDKDQKARAQSDVDKLDKDLQRASKRANDGAGEASTQKLQSDSQGSPHMSDLLKDVGDFAKTDDQQHAALKASSKHADTQQAPVRPASAQASADAAPSLTEAKDSKAADAPKEGAKTHAKSPSNERAADSNKETSKLPGDDSSAAGDESQHADAPKGAGADKKAAKDASKTAGDEKNKAPIAAGKDGKAEVAESKAQNGTANEMGKASKTGKEAGAHADGAEKAEGKFGKAGAEAGAGAKKPEAGGLKKDDEHGAQMHTKEEQASTKKDGQKQKDIEEQGKANAQQRVKDATPKLVTTEAGAGKNNSEGQQHSSQGKAARPEIAPQDKAQGQGAAATNTPSVAAAKQTHTASSVARLSAQPLPSQSAPQPRETKSGAAAGAPNTPVPLREPPSFGSSAKGASKAQPTGTEVGAGTGVQMHRAPAPVDSKSDSSAEGGDDGSSRGSDDSE